LDSQKKTNSILIQKGCGVMVGTINNVRRGEVWWADLSGVIGSEQGGLRPVLVIQNDTGNKFAPTVIIAAITSKMCKTKLPTHVKLSATEYGLPKDSIVLLEQVRTLDKSRLKERIGYVSIQVMQEVDKAIQISFGIISPNVNTNRSTNITYRQTTKNTIADRRSPSYV